MRHRRVDPAATDSTVAVLGRFKRREWITSCRDQAAELFLLNNWVERSELDQVQQGLAVHLLDRGQEDLTSNALEPDLHVANAEPSCCISGPMDGSTERSRLKAPPTVNDSVK